MIIVVTVRFRVGFATYTFKVKVIPNLNAPNDSKVLANMFEVLLDHAWACLSSLVHLDFGAPK